MREERVERRENGGCMRHVLKRDPHFARESTAEKHYPESIFSVIITPDVRDTVGKLEFILS